MLAANLLLTLSCVSYLRMEQASPEFFERWQAERGGLDPAAGRNGGERSSYDRLPQRR